MQLVIEGETKDLPIQGDDKGLGVLTWRSYVPLILIILLILGASSIFSWRDYSTGQFSIFNFISYFMTGFFLIFAGFKMADLSGFAHGYATYDLLAQRLPIYGYIYPFIEFGFGFAMFLGFQNQSLLWAEVIVMAFSGIGVAIKISKHQKFQCVCLGTILKVPLTTITLVEDFGMAALALVLLSR